LKFGVQECIEDRLEELAEILAVAVGCFSVIDGLGRLHRSPLSPGKGVDLGEGTLYRSFTGWKRRGCCVRSGRPTAAGAVRGCGSIISPTRVDTTWRDIGKPGRSS
jgi:hypothetical protein